MITLSSLEPGRRYAAWARVGGRTVALGSAAPDAAGRAILTAEDPALADAPEGGLGDRLDRTTRALLAALIYPPFSGSTPKRSSLR